MKRIALLCAAVALLAAGNAGNAGDGAYFAGSWICGEQTAWAFAPLPGGKNWLQVTYGPASAPYGTAVMGYAEGLHAWVYRDFHADGGYADLSSPGPAGGRWVWSGPYYPAAGAVVNGRITYVEVDAKRYDRIFETLENGVAVKKGSDSCLKSP